MRFGFFDDANKEYVITTPKTPYPWANYLGNDAFYSIVTNTSGGYSFYKDPRLMRITRYRYNDIPVDINGKYFYINDNGDCWSTAWMPMKKELDFYECRHGLGYTKLISERNGIRACELMFVPLNYDGEIKKLTITNTSKEKKNIKLFSFVEFCFWNAYDDMTNFQRNYNIGEVEVEGSVIYHKTEYRERRNHYSFYSVNTHIDGFDTDRDTFLGSIYNGLEAPERVLEGKPGNSLASGWAPIASHFISISLEPGEEKTFIFILGYVENPPEEKWESLNIINKAKAYKMIRQFETVEQVDAAFSALKAYWDELLSAYQLKSSDEKLNRMVNIWNQYQCMTTFKFSRSASLFESGIGRGMGFRDSNQDLIGIVHLIPDRARERIIDLASTQFPDGSTYHQYQPLTKKGNHDSGKGFNDDPLWLVLGTLAYIKETGDFSILYEQVPFENNESNTAPLLDHLRASINYTLNNLGPHGLPLIGRADWNDCLNLNCFSSTPGESFQTVENIEGRIAESVFIAGMFVGIGSEYVELLRKIGMNEEADKIQSHIVQMYQAVIRHGWDGEWFLRAYDAFGNKVGSRECEEGKIYIEPQGFCVMAGIGIQEGLAEKALDSVKKYLDTEYGLVLVQPAYSKYYLHLGEISSYPPGYKENASIFCHNNPWVAIAETCIGRGQRAFEIYKKITPAYIEDVSDIHKTEPYVYSQTIAGKDSPRFGEAKNSWLTGTAAWSFYAISQAILGIKTHFDGLIIDPCIPPELKSYEVRRKFRNSFYRIKVENPNGVEKGVKEIWLDGEPVSGNLIPPFNDGKEHEVRVIMG